MPDQTHSPNASILATLRSAEAQRINFHLGPWHIDGAAFERIARAIEVGDIKIRVEPLPQDVEARYDDFNDYVVVPPAFFAGTVGDRAAIIHECVHAIVDLQNSKGQFESSNEAAAFLASFLFRLNSGEAIPPATGGNANVRLVTTAEGIARNLQKQPGAAVPTRDLSDLRWSIATHPHYRTKGVTYISPNSSDGLFRLKMRRKSENTDPNRRGQTDLNYTKNLPPGSRLA
ncbi:hypothetical protein [Bradyrhizobium sp. 6(2017)]|uniref:hypothetical protein n=1 Tax=Bradyrhizobium sp. 6(2017) TaxID=1197460 RepID=UPI0013E1D94B|nr:hypothetical protein [Bradyrhizobium sp. 6(2017)]QIG92277.1 hypothetical protein G6P99_07015 [Bradyrhizobium sp. 6(2017)]